LGFLHSFVHDEVSLAFAGSAFREEGRLLGLFLYFDDELGLSAVSELVLSDITARSVSHGAGLTGFELL
jgi:hypothetical protein